MRRMILIMVLFLVVCSAFTVVAVSHLHHSPWISQLEKHWLVRKIELYNAGFKVDVIKERVGVNE